LLLQKPKGLLAHELIVVDHENVCHKRSDPRLGSAWAQVTRKLTPF
jgi:hypothetical protein